MFALGGRSQCSEASVVAGGRCVRKRRWSQMVEVFGSFGGRGWSLCSEATVVAVEGTNHLAIEHQRTPRDCTTFAHHVRRFLVH